MVVLISEVALKGGFSARKINPTSPVLALGEVLPEANVYTTNG
jgi:hypothetical protein